MEVAGNEKVAHFYHCLKCDYYTSKKYNYHKHILTAKHQNCYFGNKMEINGNESINDYKSHKCFCCGNHYKTESGLWKHSKKSSKCSQTNKKQLFLEVIQKDDHIKEFLIEQNKQLIDKLTEQNQSLLIQNKQLIEMVQTNSTNSITNSNVNSNNKFSINVFLNETCKDAINLSEFVDQITLTVSDLEETGKLGYAEGISRVFIKNLNEIDYTKRPIHCSDSKREILYIKDDNQWIKDNENKDKITNAIKQVTHKNIRQIPEWQKENPEYSDPDSKQNDKYMKLLYEVMSGSTKEEQRKNYEKIIKNIAKETVIDK
jgi:hypothetical protein